MIVDDLLNLKWDAKNEEVRKALLKLCTSNRKLKNFINKVFRENKNKEICAWDDYGWEWDVECYGEEGIEIAICNHDYRDDEDYDGDGWEMLNGPMIFANYFDSFNFDDITLDNGKYLLLVDEELYWAFHIVDGEKMQDGKVDFCGITW